jgi:hypothetical protein
VAKNVGCHALQPGFTANSIKHLSHPDEVALSAIRWENPPSTCVLGVSLRTSIAAAPTGLTCGPLLVSGKFTPRSKSQERSSPSAS